MLETELLKWKAANYPWPKPPGQTVKADKTIQKPLLFHGIHTTTPSDSLPSSYASQLSSPFLPHSHRPSKGKQVDDKQLIDIDIDQFISH